MHRKIEFHMKHKQETLIVDLKVGTPGCLGSTQKFVTDLQQLHASRANWTLLIFWDFETSDFEVLPRVWLHAQEN